MTLKWVREENPRWDADKQRVIGGAPEGAFVLKFADGEALPGEWWSVRDGESGPSVGYGRLDIDWGGEAEILIAVDPERERQGVGSFILGKLDTEARRHGINYVHNRIREHDKRDFVHDWLVVRGFSGPADGDLRRRVGAFDYTKSKAAAPAEPEPYTPPRDDLGPGHEEQGGYVDVDEHNF